MSNTCKPPAREAMLCVTLGAAGIRRVLCVECQVVLRRQADMGGRPIDVHHGGSVATLPLLRGRERYRHDGTADAGVLALWGQR